MTDLIVYTRDTAGLLTRFNTGPQTQADHMDRCNVSAEITSIETLLGWPESTVEWHGSTGYGK